MGTAGRIVRTTLHAVITPAEDVPGQWIAHCLELDVVTQGNDPSHAVEMIVEALGIVIEADLAQGDDPLRVRRSAPEEYWQEFLQILKSGQPVSLNELQSGSIGALVVDLDLFRPSHPAMSIQGSEPMLVPHVARARLEDRPSML